MLPNPSDDDDDDVIVEFDLDASYAHPPALTAFPLLAEGNDASQGILPTLPQDDNQSESVKERDAEGNDASQGIFPTLPPYDNQSESVKEEGTNKLLPIDQSLPNKFSIYPQDLRVTNG